MTPAHPPAVKAWSHAGASGKGTGETTLLRLMHNASSPVTWSLPAPCSTTTSWYAKCAMSAVDMSVDIKKVENPPGVPRMVINLNGKWLQYRKYHRQSSRFL